MSLRSGKHYQPASQQQDEKVEKQQEPSEGADVYAWSVHSQSSRRSSRTSSSASSSAIKACAKAEAAHAQLAFAKKEASLIKQKADLKASRHILQSQKAVAATTAEAAAYEEVEKSNRSELSQDLLDVRISPSECTSEYVQKHSQVYSKEIPFNIEPSEWHMRKVKQPLVQKNRDRQYGKLMSNKSKKRKNFKIK